MAATVSMEEYLRTSYRPDVEYIDGELREKTTGEFTHGEAEGILGSWFLERRKEWQILCALNTRTQTSSHRVRLVHVVVVGEGSRERQQLTHPPLLTIEVLCTDDIPAELEARAADLESMGVRNIWLIDPYARTEKVWSAGKWRVSQSSRLRTVEGTMFLDLNWVWQQMEVI